MSVKLRPMFTTDSGSFKVSFIIVALRYPIVREKYKR